MKSKKLTSLLLSATMALGSLGSVIAPAITTSVLAAEAEAPVITPSDPSNNTNSGNTASTAGYSVTTISTADENGSATVTFADGEYTEPQMIVLDANSRVTNLNIVINGTMASAETAAFTNKYMLNIVSNLATGPTITLSGTIENTINKSGGLAVNGNIGSLDISASITSVGTALAVYAGDGNSITVNVSGILTTNGSAGNAGVSIGQDFGNLDWNSNNNYNQIKATSGRAVFLQSGNYTVNAHYVAPEQAMENANVTLNVSGTISSTDPGGHAAIGTSLPAQGYYTINILENSNVSSKGSAGLDLAPLNAVTTVKGNVTGTTGIDIIAGTLNVEAPAVIKATDPSFDVGFGGYYNGETSSGVGIIATGRYEYLAPKVTIKGGTIESPGIGILSLANTADIFSLPGTITKETGYINIEGGTIVSTLAEASPVTIQKGNATNPADDQAALNYTVPAYASIVVPDRDGTPVGVIPTITGGYFSQGISPNQINLDGVVLSGLLSSGDYRDLYEAVEGISYESVAGLASNQIQATEASYNLTAGQTATPKLSVPQGSNYIFTWSSDNTSVATVDPETGVITAQGSGKATITVKLSYKDGSGAVQDAETTIVINVTASTSQQPGGSTPSVPDEKPEDPGDNVVEEDNTVENEDGSYTTTVTTESGITTVTDQDEDGNVTSVEVTVPESAIYEGNVFITPGTNTITGEKIGIPGNITNEDTAPEVTINLPKSDQTVNVTIELIPGTGSLGTVAMVLNDNDKWVPIVDSVIDSKGNLIIPTTGGTVLIKNNAKAFPDLDGSEWYVKEGAVAFVSARNIINGNANGHFDADGTVTRAMFSRMLWNLAGNPATTAARPSDVPAGEYFSESAAWAAAQKFMGVGSEFNPYENLTREQLVTILWRYAGEPEASIVSLNGYSDKDQVQNFALEPMAWAVANKIVGVGSNLDPLSDASRAEMAAIIERFLLTIWA